MTFDPIEPMEGIDNPAIGGHTQGDKGLPIAEYEFTTPEGESATLNTRARTPEDDEEHGPHVNLVSNIDDQVGMENTHVQVDNQDIPK